MSATVVGTGTDISPRRFLDTRQPPTPCLVMDLDVVADRYARLRAALPHATVYYAVKANPELALLRVLVDLGASFDVASPGEVDLALEAGAPPEHISYGDTIKKRRDIAHAYATACGCSPSTASPNWKSWPSPLREHQYSVASWSRAKAPTGR